MDHHVKRRRVIRAKPVPVSPEERARLERDHQRTHPPQVERIRGCCDPPEP